MTGKILRPNHWQSRMSLADQLRLSIALDQEGRPEMLPLTGADLADQAEVMDVPGFFLDDARTTAKPRRSAPDPVSAVGQVLPPRTEAMDGAARNNPERGASLQTTLAIIIISSAGMVGVLLAALAFAANNRCFG